MTAINKTIPIHSTSVNPLLKYCGNKNKTSISRNQSESSDPDKNLANALDYASNPLKTICNVDENHKELLISGVGCNPNTAAQEFTLAREHYKEATGRSEVFEPFDFTDRKGNAKSVQRQPVTATHLIQSFAEPGLDPHTVHQIGVELAERLGVQAVVDTHLNKEHLHNHIIINSYMEDGTKFNCNKEMRLKIREISDEIQREYGIPIRFEEPEIQQQISRSRSKSYAEWSAEKDGTSWKDAMRQDIQTIASITDNRADYLAIMEEYGYKVLDVDKYNTLFETPNGRKITDSVLGDGYSIGDIFPMEKEEKPLEQIPVHYHKVISISRYDKNGQRRGELELLIRRAIALIQKIGNFFRRLRNGEEDHERTPSQKIVALQEALKTVQKYDLDTTDDLREKTSEVGSQLNHVKAELAKMDRNKDLMETIDSALYDIEQAREVHTHVGELYLYHPTEEQILAARAELSPASPELHNKLNRLLYQHPEYKLTCRYTKLPAADIDDLIAFLRNGSGERPPYLLTVEEYDARVLERKLEKTYENNQGKRTQNAQKAKHATEAERKSIEPLLEAHGKELPEDAKLTEADVQNIRNCWGEIPFTEPLINAEQQAFLATALTAAAKNGKEYRANRPLQYVTETEYEQVIEYVNRGKKRMKKPSLLCERQAPDSTFALLVQEYMQKKDITLTVPMAFLSKRDVFDLYSSIVAHGRTPDMFQEHPTKQAVTTESNNIEGTEIKEARKLDENTVDSNEFADVEAVSKEEPVPVRTAGQDAADAMFYARTSDYNISKTLYLATLRNALNTLRRLGYDVDVNSDISELQKMVNDWKDKRTMMEQDKEHLATDYRELMKAKNTIAFAKYPEYLYGIVNEDEQREIESHIETKYVDRAEEETDMMWEPSVAQDMEKERARGKEGDER